MRAKKSAQLHAETLKFEEKKILKVEIWYTPMKLKLNFDL